MSVNFISSQNIKIKNQIISLLIKNLKINIKKY